VQEIVQAALNHQVIALEIDRHENNDDRGEEEHRANAENAFYIEYGPLSAGRFYIGEKETRDNKEQRNAETTG